MPRFRVPMLFSAALLAWLPATARAQNASVAATATVQPLSLAVVDVARTAVPGELLVRVAGCGAGAVTVDARTATGMIRRTRLPLTATATCMPRDVRLQLAEPATTAIEYLVGLEQSDRLPSPSFSQFVVPAGLVRYGAAPSLSY
jgi:hypothetical protein